MADGGAGGTNQVQGVTLFVGREVNVLGDIEKCQSFQKFRCCCAVCVNVNVKVAQQ